MTRAHRIIAVTAGLAAGGAVLGTLAGVLAIAVVLGVVGWRSPFDDLVGLFQLAAFFGAPMGAIGLPLLGWALLRYVPLWQVMLYSVLGTVFGGVFYGLIGAAVGFFLAAVGMRLTARKVLTAAT